MNPNPSILLQKAGITAPLIGFYDAPNPQSFEPVVAPKSGTRMCIFQFFDNWMNGETLHLTISNFGCGGAGRCMFGVQTRTLEDFIHFLVDDEGLKATHELMNQWIESNQPYISTYKHILIGPLKEAQYDQLKTITFFVNPDQ